MRKGGHGKRLFRCQAPIFTIPAIAILYNKVPIIDIPDRSCSDIFRRRRNIPSLYYRFQPSIFNQSMKMSPSQSRCFHDSCTIIFLISLQFGKRRSQPFFRCCHLLVYYDVNLLVYYAKLVINDKDNMRI